MTVSSKLSPLAGVRILDFTRILAGPFCTMLLGDLGAEILKIEKPGSGDDTRQWKPPSIGNESAYFLSVNRNKKSVTLNLQHATGRSIAKKLAAKSDVLIENFIPGTMDRHGLGYADFRQDQPGLIYCSLSGYGTSGPWAQRGGYDVIAAAIGGFLNITGPKDGEPCKPGVAVTDLLTGLYTHGAIMAALIHREKTGLGQKIESDLLSAQIATLINIGSNYLNCGVEGSRWGTAHQSIVPYQAFRTSDDRWLVVGAGTDNLFTELCLLIGRPDLLANPSYRTNSDRVCNREVLVEEIQKRFLCKTCAEWEKIFESSSMPLGRVNNLEEAFSHPQVLHKGMVQTMSHPVAGQISVTGPAVQYSESENRVRSPPPTLGQHTEQVLASLLGKTEKEIEQLKNETVI